jgi:ribosomal protein L25 (general stress protein Ctc)
MSTTEETITIALRKEVGKSASHSLRRQGLIPATIYGLAERSEEHTSELQSQNE